MSAACGIMEGGSSGARVVDFQSCWEDAFWALGACVLDSILKAGETEHNKKKLEQRTSAERPDQSSPKGAEVR